jgi:hypothetical protein
MILLCEHPNLVRDARAPNHTVSESYNHPDGVGLAPFFPSVFVLKQRLPGFESSLRSYPISSCAFLVQRRLRAADYLLGKALWGGWPGTSLYAVALRDVSESELPPKGHVRALAQEIEK